MKKDRKKCMWTSHLCNMLFRWFLLSALISSHRRISAHRSVAIKCYIIKWQNNFCSNFFFVLPVIVGGRSRGAWPYACVRERTDNSNMTGNQNTRSVSTHMILALVLFIYLFYAIFLVAWSCIRCRFGCGCWLHTSYCRCGPPTSGFQSNVDADGGTSTANQNKYLL